MSISTRIIRRRIRSVANTRKITRAMELVSAAKMRRAVSMTLASRPFAAIVRDIVRDVSGMVDPMSHPLLVSRPHSVSAMVVIASSDRGLCGGFNTQLLKKSLDFLRSRIEKELKVVTVGRRAESAVKRAGYSIYAAFEAISSAPSFDRTVPIGHLIYDDFMQKKSDRVFLSYTDFRSAISQIPTVIQLLPIIPEVELASKPATTALTEDEAERAAAEARVLFEPNPGSVLGALLPRMLEVTIYQSLLESAASEHSARMLAMRNATDNASNMLEDLTFTYNQTRQSNITREISEISAGKAAVE